MKNICPAASPFGSGECSPFKEHVWLQVLQVHFELMYVWYQVHLLTIAAYEGTTYHHII
jgi:hypothetical protein